MKNVLIFVSGALFGAAIALMYAPSSGDELRSNIKSQAETQSAKMQEQWQERVQKLQANVDKINSELQAMKKQSPDIEPVVFDN